jgi:hypothetical protein
VVIRRYLVCTVALSALAALVARAVLVDDARAITFIAPLAAETPVRAWAGIAVLSVQQPDGTYRLATQQGTEAPRVLPGIAAASYPFDANIGPGPDGSPLIVFARCARPPTRGPFSEAIPRHCALVQTSVAGSSETPIASAAGRDAHAPAIWGNRLVFAQSARHRSDWIYIVPLQGGTHRRPVRLRSAPLPECLGIIPGEQCFAAKVHPTVTELSLRGSTLAEVLDLGTVNGGDFCPATEVRLLHLAHHAGKRVDSAICREGGFTLLGASLTATHLLFTSECGGAAQDICQYTKTLVYRYGLRNHRLEAAPEHDLVTGFAALDDDHAVEVAAPTRLNEPGSVSAGEENCTFESRRANESLQNTPPLCILVHVGPIRFSRSALRLRE